MMSAVRRFVLRLYAFVRPGRADRDLAREVSSHLRILEDELRRRGMTAAEARVAARRRLGGVDRAMEWARDARSFPWLEDLRRDLGHALRNLAKTPSFTAVAVVTLALGIGANTAIFSLVKSVLWRPLPYEDAGRLVLLRDMKPPQFTQGIEVAPGHFVQWRQRNAVFEDIGAYVGTSFNLTDHDARPERIRAVRMSAGLLALLGVQPARGRDFRPDEDQPDRDAVVIISHEFWQRRFACDPGLLGRSLSLDGRPYVVIGMMPPEFEFPGPGIDLWVPLALTAEERASHGNHYLFAVAKRRPDVSLEQARSAMDTIAQQLALEHPRLNAGWGVRLDDLRDSRVGDTRPTLLLLLGAVGFVLLIACANVANMLLSQAAGRQREMAIRHALGASHGRLVRQLLTESVLLAAAGGSVGLLVAAWGVGLAPTLAPDLPRVNDVSLDGGVLVLTAIIAILTGIVFGASPAMQVAKLPTTRPLSDGARAVTAGTGRARLRRVLVSSEVALALVLLIGAGLLMRSVERLQQVDPGFRPDHVLLVTLDLPTVAYSDFSQVTAFFKTLLGHVSTLPGVQAVGAAHALPFFRDHHLGLVIEGRPPAAPADRPSVNYYPVSQGYFAAMGIPLIQGRVFTDRDRHGAPGVVIINDTLARRYFPGEDAIGKRLHVTNRPESFREIVGIVGDVQQYGLDQAPPAQVYEPFDQQLHGDWDLTLVVRSARDPANLTAAIQAQLRSLDRDVPLSDVQTLESGIARWMVRRRAPTLALAVFAGTAILLAAVGIYGVIAYSVAQRTREVGIRRALGAARTSLFMLVMREAIAMTVVGLLVGAGVAVAVTRALTNLLYDISPTDPATFVALSLTLFAIALVASSVPARRAIGLDPLVALRSE